MNNSFDTLVIGGGIVGMSVGYGLARAGERVCVIDGNDDAFRASRGNFGLVWVQNKGLNKVPYAQWTMESARTWGTLAAELNELTGIDLELQQLGGLSMSFDEHSLQSSAAKLNVLGEQLGIRYPFEILDADRLRKLTPHIGPDVVGAVYCPLDGHVSPLRLLRALINGFLLRGGSLLPGMHVSRIEYRDQLFHVHTQSGVHVSPRVVLAAGLGNPALAMQLGLDAPVRPQRGQILVTERMQPFLHHPCHFVRQTGEGVVQIGDSKEEVGFDDGTTLGQLAHIAARAIRCFPLLGQVNVVRTWGALRVMTPDGYPIYDQSETCPGAFLVTCHSGVTLAPVHAGPLVDWIRGVSVSPAIQSLSAERFHVQAH